MPKGRPRKSVWLASNGHETANIKGDANRGVEAPSTWPCTGFSWGLRPKLMSLRTVRFHASRAVQCRNAVKWMVGCVAWLLGSLLFVSLPSLVAAQDDPIANQAGTIVLRGHQLLRSGEVREALELLDQAVASLSSGGDRQLLLAARVNRAHALAQSGRVLEAMAEFAASIALADILSSGPDLAAADLGVGVRLQLAEMLADHGRSADAQAAAWDALQAAVDLKTLTSVGPALRTVILMGVAADDSEAALLALLEAANQELMALDDYRLANPPPPEPIIAVLEDSARALASRKELPAARELFELILMLDLARGAHWRLVSDLSDLSWVSLQLNDLLSAHWALQWTDALFEGERAAGLWANWASLQASSGDFVAAERSYRAALKTSVKEDSPARTRALSARLARTVELLGGREEESLALSRGTAQAYRKAGDESSALAEELRVAAQMLDLGRADDAAALLAGVIGAIESGAGLAVDEQVFMHLVSARLSEQRGELETARSALSAAGKLLFDLGHVDELAALATSFGDIELRGERPVEAGEAFDNAELFEGQLGLGSEAWYSMLGKARLAQSTSDPEAAIRFLQRARERVNWQAALPGSFQDLDSHVGKSSQLQLDGESVYRELAALYLSRGSWGALLETIAAARELRRVSAFSDSANLMWRRQGLQQPVGGAAEDLRRMRGNIEKIRSRLRDEAIQPSAEDPAQMMTDLLEQLSRAREEEAELLEALAAEDARAHATQSVAPVSSAQLQGALAPGEVLLISYDLDEEIVVLAVSAKDQVSVSLPDPASIASELDRLWQQYGGRRVGPANRHKLKVQLESLSERVLQPLNPLLETARTIFWSPDPALRLLPLAALVLDEKLLSERAQIFGVQSVRTLLESKRAGNGTSFSSLRVLADPAQPSSTSSSDLSSLRRQLRGLRRGDLAAVLGGGLERQGGELLVLPPKLSATHRLSYLSMTEGPSLFSLRSAQTEDRFLQVLARELEQGETLTSAMKGAMTVTRRKRLDPLGWAALMLWLD